MKAILNIAVLAVLVFGGSSRCFADRSDHPVSEQMAQEWGVKISWTAYNTNDIGIRFELSPRGKLARFNGCTLVVASDGRELLKAPLLLDQPTDEKVALGFLVARDFVQKSSLMIMCDEYILKVMFFP